MQQLKLAVLFRRICRHELVLQHLQYIDIEVQIWRVDDWPVGAQVNEGLVESAFDVAVHTFMA